MTTSPSLFLSFSFEKTVATNRNAQITAGLQRVTLFSSGPIEHDAQRQSRTERSQKDEKKAKSQWRTKRKENKETEKRYDLRDIQSLNNSAQVRSQLTCAGTRQHLKADLQGPST
jgi:hypothetical protein